MTMGVLSPPPTTVHWSCFGESTRPWNRQRRFWLKRSKDHPVRQRPKLLKLRKFISNWSLPGWVLTSITPHTTIGYQFWITTIFYSLEPISMKLCMKEIFVDFFDSQKELYWFDLIHMVLKWFSQKFSRYFFGYIFKLCTSPKISQLLCYVFVCIWTALKNKRFGCLIIF